MDAAEEVEFHYIANFGRDNVGLERQPTLANCDRNCLCDCARC